MLGYALLESFIFGVINGVHFQDAEDALNAFNGKSFMGTKYVDMPSSLITACPDLFVASSSSSQKKVDQKGIRMSLIAHPGPDDPPVSVSLCLVYLVTRAGRYGFQSALPSLLRPWPACRRKSLLSRGEPLLGSVILPSYW